MTETMLIITPAIIIGIIIAMVIARVRSSISVIKLSNRGVCFLLSTESHFQLWSCSSRCKAVQTNTQAE